MKLLVRLIVLLTLVGCGLRDPTIDRPLGGHGGVPDVGGFGGSGGDEPSEGVPSSRVYCDGIADCPAIGPCFATWCRPVTHEANPDNRWGICENTRVAEGGPCAGGTSSCIAGECIPTPPDAPETYEWTNESERFYVFAPGAHGPPDDQAAYVVYVPHVAPGDEFDVTVFGFTNAVKPGTCDLRVYTETYSSDAPAQTLPIAVEGHGIFPTTLTTGVLFGGKHTATSGGLFAFRLLGSAADGACEFGGVSAIRIVHSN